MRKKIQKNFLLTEIIVSELALKLFLLRMESLSGAVNPLTNTFKTFHMNKSDLSQPNCLHSDQ